LWRVEPDGTESWDLEEDSMRYARAVHPESDGGYVVAGGDFTGGFLSGYYCFALMRVNAQGQRVRVIKSDSGEARAIDIAQDGSYVLAGSCGYESQPCVLKVDTSGQTIWYGPLTHLRGSFTSVIATPDGGALAAGVARDLGGSRDNVVLVRFSPPEE